ncbi:DUF397 domain-containing protein [Haloechinothrix sp. YIM 98757]|uniref:DUF397 domain-containing protein n=1 Tax=Haloechinothrix aidingensis TaxID=2752311 RepID=A0A838ADQ5_9PSEU|nr:DUF397 domain-containing protein [Haloechinothrix aidingensis]MBA0127317.1 DUF397 domain-containing protein [Haloechinothrix aidingensis]
MPRTTGGWFVPRRSADGSTCGGTAFTADAVHVRSSLARDAGTATFTHEE